MFLLQAEAIFESIKAHLKRAPSLRGAALVRLSSLKIQAKPWPTLFNTSEALKKLNEVITGSSLILSDGNYFVKIFHLNLILKDLHQFVAEIQ